MTIERYRKREFESYFTQGYINARMQASSSTAMRYCEPVLFLTLFILQSTRAMKAFAPAQVQLQQTAHRALCPLHERARIDYGTGYDPKKRPQVALRAPMYLDNVALDTQE